MVLLNLINDSKQKLPLLFQLDTIDKAYNFKLKKKLEKHLEPKELDLIQIKSQL